MTGHVNLPAYTFERLMEVNEGMKEGVLNGYKVMKTVTKCRIPEYMRESFKDNYVCCTLCATCKRKKDVYGRKGHGQYGLDTRCSIE